MIDSEELLLVLSLIALISLEILNAYRSRSPLQVYRPTLFVAAVLAYYVLFGPLQALAFGHGLYYRGIDHSDVVVWGWLCAVVFYGSLLLGFYANTRPAAPKRIATGVTPQQLHILGVRLCLAGLIMFALVSGTTVIALLNPFATKSLLEDTLGGQGGVDTGAISNYFNYSINLMIPGILLQAASWMQNKKHTLTIISWTLAASCIYISLGFRYRLVLLLVPLILIWFVARAKRPRILILSIFLIGFVALNSLIGLTRSYGRGLDIGSLDEGVSVYEITNSGLSETGVFLASSGVIEQTPGRRSPYVGLQPFMATLFFPIPRAWFPGKPDATYTKDALSEFYGSEHLATGTAMMNFAEYYLIAGFPSLIAISFLLGCLLRRLWSWFLVRSHEPIAQCIYILSASYLYVVISRGYMPQVAMLFCFSVLPLFWLYGRLSIPVSTVHQRPWHHDKDYPSLPRQ